MEFRRVLFRSHYPRASKPHPFWQQARFLRRKKSAALPKVIHLGEGHEPTQSSRWRQAETGQKATSHLYKQIPFSRSSGGERLALPTWFTASALAQNQNLQGPEKHGLHA